jgi:hypothetical protein
MDHEILARLESAEAEIRKLRAAEREIIALFTSAR